MRKGYRLEQSGFRSIYSSLYAPSGEFLATVTYTNQYDKEKPFAVVNSFVEGIENKTAANHGEFQMIVDTFTDEHYKLTTTRQQRFHDMLNNCVDFPVVKLIGIVAAIVAAAASVRGCMN